MIERGKGNLLEAQVDALVNTVNTEGVMGKGIALQFKKAFPRNFEIYERECKSEHVEIGKMLVVETQMLMPKYIINFPTKKHWRAPSRLAYIEAGLVNLVDRVRALAIRSIAVPPLGCGNGGLHWSDVRPLIEAALEPLPDVRVVLFEPKGAPEPEKIVDRTKKPSMTIGRAALIKLMHAYLATGYEYRLSLIEIQKLAYFLQEAGERLRLDYKPHVYGPYADTLRHVLNRIEGHYTTGFGDGRSAPETPIELLRGAVDAAESFLAEHKDTLGRIERVLRLIESFETPFGMELLATVHWVLKHEASGDDVVASVHAWSSRKAATMKPQQIASALERLHHEGWS